MTGAPGGRLARWSQRKAAARRGGALPTEQERAPAHIRPDDEQPSAHERQDAALEAREIAKTSDAAPVAGEDVPVLPPIEELTFQSDFTAFMAKNVPEAIRHAALRKLWLSDPVLANLDGLNDYCEDHHLIDTSITLDQTSYKVGKGYFDEIEEKLAELDGAPSGHGGEGSGTNSELKEARDDGVVSKTTVDDSDAAGDERPAAARQGLAAKPDEVATAPEENAAKQVP
jgi:hypothetical protein